VDARKLKCLSEFTGDPNRWLDDFGDRCDLDGVYSRGTNCAMRPAAVVLLNSGLLFFSVGFDEVAAFSNESDQRKKRTLARGKSARKIYL
jgi:hypothetical protein